MPFVFTKKKNRRFIGSCLYRDLHNLRDNTCSSGGTTVCHVPEKQYLCNVIQDRVTLTIPSARRGM